MVLLANRVSDALVPVNTTSVWSASLVARIVSASCRMRSSPYIGQPALSPLPMAGEATSIVLPRRAGELLHQPYLHISKAGRRRAVANVCHLHRLALAAVGRAPDAPLAADGVAAGPELGRDAGIGGIFVDASQLAAFDLAAPLGAKLEAEPPVVDAPALVGLHVQAIVGVGDQVRKRPGAGLEIDVRHPDERNAVPAIGARGAVRGDAVQINARRIT